MNIFGIRVNRIEIIISLVVIISTILRSQSWNPEINFRPRVVYIIEDLSAIQSRLSQSPYSYLWFNQESSGSSIYKSAQREEDQVQNSKTNPRNFTDPRSKIAKDAAFVYAMNRMANGIDALGNNTSSDNPLSRDEYLEKALVYLRTLDTEVLGPEIFGFNLLQDAPLMNNWQHRGEELIYYCQAYDMLLGAGIDAEELIEENIAGFADDLLTQYSKFKEIGEIIIARNNHKLIIAAALGTAAVTLNQHESSLKWITAASILNYWVLFHDENETADGYKQINTDGGYGEGPNYMRYAFMKLIPMFIALDNFDHDWEETFDRAILEPGFYPLSIGQIQTRSPLYDSRYTALYEWINNIRLQDGRMPSIEDTPSQEYFPELAIISEKYSFPMRSADPSISSNKLLSDKLSTLRVDYICAGNFKPGAVVDPDLSLNLPDAGLAVFRNSWEQDGIYFNISADNGLAHLQERGHGHADVTSFILSYKGIDLIKHPGYGGWDQRYRLNRHKNHNAVLVKDLLSSDYYGAVPPTGPAVSFSLQMRIEQIFDPSITQGYLQKFYVDDYLSYVQVHTNYGKRYLKETPLVYIPLENQEVWSVDSDDPTDIDFYRRVAFVDHKYFVIIDDIFNNLEETRSYAWRVHLNTGYGTGGQFFVDENGGIISKSGVYCKLFTTASSGVDSIKIGSDYHADNNGEEFFFQHETVTMFSTGDSPVLLSILYPYDNEEPDFTEFQNGTTLGIIIPVEGSQNKIDVILSRLGNQDIEYPVSTVNGYNLPQIASDANVLILRIDQNSGSLVPLHYFGNDGTYLEVNGAEYTLDLMDETIPDNADNVSKLYPNFPNPFNENTKIQFKIYRESQITLSIFELSGRTVVKLAQGKFSPGLYEAGWNGRDGNGKLVASGMYYYTLLVTSSGKSSIKSRKLIFIK
jgi:hypothetical protein